MCAPRRAPTRPLAPYLTLDGSSGTRAGSAHLEGPVIARIDDLMDKVDSKFHLVHLAAQRAREINGYYAQLGEGLGTHVPPLVSVPSNKPLSIALEEIAQGKIEGVEPTEGEGGEDPLGFIGGDDDLGA